jgi:uncharacterized protein YndB with AHSA1/START domain
MSLHAHEFEPRQGGALRVSLTYESPDAKGKSSAHTDTYRGRFAELVENERIVEVDEFESNDPALRGAMTITIQLRDAPDGGTELRVSHENLPSTVSMADNETGWNMALDKLAALLERRVESASGAVPQL